MELKTTLPLLRQNFDLELGNTLTLNDVEHQAVFACYDRAVSNTLLAIVDGAVPSHPSLTAPLKVHAGPKAGSKAAKDRAAKASATRAANRKAREAETDQRLANIQRANSGDGQEAGAGGGQ